MEAFFSSPWIGITLIVVIIVVIFALPPSRDPAIKLKERQEDGRTAKERADVDAINKGVCPDCGESTLLTGPSGGMSQNVLCNSCLMEFNVHFGFGTGALGVDRTGKADEGRAAVFGVQPDEYQEITS